jgi:hypothetical protein
MFTLYKLRTDKCVLMRKLPQSWERIYQKEWERNESLACLPTSQNRNLYD